MSYDNQYFDERNFSKWKKRNQDFFRNKQKNLLKGFFDFSLPVLDVACGSTPLNKVIKELNVTGTDLHYTSKNVIKADVNKLPFKNNTIDQIYCWCLLEHLPKPELALKEMNRVLKKGGKIILSTELPDKNFYKKDNTHIQPFTVPQLQKMFSEAGFDKFNTERELFYFKGITYLPFMISYFVGKLLFFLSPIIIVKSEKK
jgi:ubiquinone/menaquinone biosynthesis C-methylase UbiE